MVSTRAFTRKEKGKPEQAPEHMRPVGLSPEIMTYFKEVLRQMAERNKAFSKDLTAHARDYGIEPNRI